MAGSDAATDRIADAFERLSAPILVVSLLLTAFLASVLVPLPAFTTDLSSFAPETDADEAQERIQRAIGASAHLIYVNVKPAVEEGSEDFLPNVLEMRALHQLAEDHSRIQAYSDENGGFVISQLNAAEILQRTLEERNHSGPLSDFSDWRQMLEGIGDGAECGDALDSDERTVATASFASSAMLHSDLDYRPVCDWLDTGEGNPTPTASSTLWLIEMSGDISNEDRRAHATAIRVMLTSEPEAGEAVLEYGVISDDLISNDINESTLDNLVWLILLAVIVVVILLALSFRSFTMVAVPLTALLAALVWTYGAIALSGMRFSVLEIAVAPVVLALGIDYSIHLQRGYEKAKDDSDSAAEAWARAFMDLRMALSLAVVTTMFAFLSNSFSPLPPLRTFGLTLALGVASAFVASTVTVGAMHVVLERTTGASTNRGLELDAMARVATEFQRGNAPLVLLTVAIITAGSIVVAQQGLETSFELSDFLSDDEMEVMKVRNDLYDSYEVNALKSVYILVEPAEGENSFSDEESLIDALRGVEDSLLRIPGVVVTEAPGTSNEWGSYDSIYRIIGDAIEQDEGFGLTHNLEVFGEDVATTADFREGDLTLAITALQSNESVGEPLRGLTWAERTDQHVALTEDGGSIRYLKIRVDVEAETSAMVYEIVTELDAEAMIISMDTGGRAYVVGDLVVLSNVLSGLISSIISSTAISLAVSMLVLTLLTRRFGQSLLVVLPVGLAGSWVVGTMALLDINWNVLTIMITALTIGLGIDYSIHVWRRFEANRAAGMAIWPAMRDMYVNTGAALLMSAGTSICGFMVLMLSPVPVIRDFGMVSSISVAFSLVLALLVLPGLLAAEVRTGSNGG
ncbi:MAG: MMPL family transporter [Candidatus Thalassarchaeaceae archaeon]|jgi:predicted RND superfamily exporter protein|nr:MMPL family transporter [Candidatus Thalassarchaeaceae archaeon]MDP7256413.1 MMPL family transporter [Candidatus Thalassarchaeaceae archaeon]MDP7446748.1 MMPL family transporter [Candidatus Thalassarchaeaceae archaeon]MDP7649863.1 MMPL family transporter [Candidatus Thalassarchaeaceae archaeon]HJL55070.1 MMPL family transporter [Candidatus Thalassarchaeaceae archaeon]|tara:strand:+ start:9440 stop:12019 length:2580 start_codon:yes stop_codon:yes gene_type:complete